jgi:hypothetical protein
MRKLVVVLALAALSACTPSEIAMWHEWRAVDPVAADAYADDVIARAEHGRCADWRDDALGVGWSVDDWPTLNRVMWAESMCLPHAQHRSGATGLLQIMPMWRDDCGGGDLFDPTFNLACGLHVLHVQGWQAWSTY